jgi:hypothetical protein
LGNVQLLPFGLVGLKKPPEINAQYNILFFVYVRLNHIKSWLFISPCTQKFQVMFRKSIFDALCYFSKELTILATLQPNFSVNEHISFSFKNSMHSSYEYIQWNQRD